MNTLSEIKDEMVSPGRSMAFGMRSPLTDAYIKEQGEDIVQMAQTVNSYLTTPQPVDEYGRRIINYDAERKWFFQNIAFVFSTGVVFDEDDQRKLDAVLRCFKDVPNVAYLNNVYFMLDYTDNVSKALSERIPGTNGGNYHILMGIISAAEDSDLNDAPTDMKTKGLVSVHVSWNEIESKVSNYVSRFGLIYEEDEHPVVNIKNQQRINRTSFRDLNPNVSPTSILQMHLDDFPRDGPVETFERKRQVRVARPLVNDQRGRRLDTDEDFRLEASKPLYDRIREDSLEALPSSIKGGEMKMDMYYLDESEQEPDFIMFPGTDTYNVPNGTNLFPNVDPMMRADMPVISTGNAKGQRARRVLNNAPLFPK